MRSRQQSTFIDTHTHTEEFFTSYNYQSHQLCRLSHEELLVPLIYWHSNPKHVITAMLVHKSLCVGEIMITGSQLGEFVIWKSKLNFLNDNEENDDIYKDISNDNIKWIAMAMTISTNTTEIKSIIGLSSYKDEISFVAIHLDGELEIFSISGSGALKIFSISDRPIIYDKAIKSIFACNKINESYKHILATDFHHCSIHLIDITKGKHITQFFLQKDDTLDNEFQVIDIAFFHIDTNTFIAIDAIGKIGVFKIDFNNNVCTAVKCMPNKTRLRNRAIAADITFNDKYLVAISYNEFVVYCILDNFISRIASKTERDVNWNGLLMIDEYINYKMLPDINDEKKTDIDENFCIVKQPFFVLLWENNSKSVMLYLVSKETSAILSPIVELIIFDNNEDIFEWNVITNDNQYIYIGLYNGKILSFSMDKLRNIAINSYSKLLNNNFRTINNSYIGKLKSNIIGDIVNSFDIKKQKQKEIDEDNNNINYIICSCMNITKCGVLLCLGYESGEIYIYNITLAKCIIQIHTRLSSVTCLLLQCINVSESDQNENNKNNNSDGILFIGYSDGYIEIFNIDNNENIFSKQCHFGSVNKIISFEQDYYIFSIGNDNAICSYLVYSQLITMKNIMEQINNNQNENNLVKWNYYRGHTSIMNSTHTIINIYRNEWCLINDFIIIELSNKEIYIWNLSTAQIERHIIDEIKCKHFKIDRSLNIGKRRNDFEISKNNNKLYNIYNLNRNSSHLCVNIMVLDIVSIFKISLNTNNDIQIDNIIRSLSLLLDWDIHSKLFNNLLFCDNFNKYLYSINYNIPIHSNNNDKNNNDLYNLLLVKDIKPCFGFIGDYQSMTMLFPICSMNGGKWKMQSKLTSIYMLAINTLCIWLQKQIQSPNKQNKIIEFINKELREFYSEILPTNLNGFIEPSKNIISRCCLSSTSSLRKTSRILLEDMVKRMSPNIKQKIVTKWENKYVMNNNSESDQTSPLTAPPNLSIFFNSIIICIIHIQELDLQIENNDIKYKKENKININKIVSLSVINILISILKEKIQHKSDEIKKSLSCYYLGRIIKSWIKQCDTNVFISLLNILLDLCSYYDDIKNKNGNILSESAMFALIECGNAETQVFIKTMGSQALQISKRGRHAKALQAIQRLIYSYPLSLLKYVPFTIKTTIKCLDPSSPQKRKILLKSTTSTLHALVHKFPNCSFHSKTQHFACGTGSSTDTQQDANDNNSIIIYDLRTATRFGKPLKQSNVSKSTITAIQFNFDGKYLCSYSPYRQPPILCIWKLNINDGVLGFFGSQSKCIKIINLNQLNKIYEPIHHITNTQIIWNNHNKSRVKLQREDKSVLLLDVL